MAVISVEVVFALVDKQHLLALELPSGSLVSDALAAAKLEHVFGGINFGTLDVGVWGRLCARDTPLQHGDRVELYRSLQIDPREMRRQLAIAGKTMRSERSADDDNND